MCTATPEPGRVRLARRNTAIGRVQGASARRRAAVTGHCPSVAYHASARRTYPASLDPLPTAQIDARHLDTSRVRGGTFATRGRLSSLAGNPPGKSPRSVGRRPRYEQEERDHRPDGATSSIPDAGPWHGPGALEGARFMVGARKYNGNHSRGSCRALFSFKIALGAPDRLIRSFVQNAQFRLTWRWLGNCSASRRTLSVPLSQVPGPARVGAVMAAHRGPRSPGHAARWLSSELLRNPLYPCSVSAGPRVGSMLDAPSVPTAALLCGRT